MTATAPLLEARALSRHYALARGLFRPADRVRALDGVSFALDAGRTLAVVGESGCGKSTLARQVTMIERPTAGALRIAGTRRGARRTRPRCERLRPLVQMVFQNPYASLNPRKKVGTLLEEPLAINSTLGAGGAARCGARHDRARRAAGRSITAAIRTCSPGGSGSASPSPAR